MAGIFGDGQGVHGGCVGCNWNCCEGEEAYAEEDREGGC